MSNFERSKVFAALLVAGIAASSSGFIAKNVMGNAEAGNHDAVVSSDSHGTSTAAAKPAMPEPILALIAGADITRGKKLSRACAACHGFDKGGPNGTGPNLWGIVNRATGTKAGYSYSTALSEQGGEWNYADLNKFLWKPKKFIKGTKMNYIGLKKPEDRAAMIAWLRSLADSPSALPTSAAIAKEAAELTPPDAETAH